MPTERLSVLAAAAALEEFTAAELAAYTGVKQGTVAQILRRESDRFEPSSQEPVGPGRPPGLWKITDREGVLAELENEERGLAAIRTRTEAVSRPTETSGLPATDTSLAVEDPQMALADALLLTADKTIASAVKATESAAQRRLARTSLNFARAAQKRVDAYAGDTNAEIEARRDGLSARAASAVAFARLLEIRSSEAAIEPTLLLDVAQSIANLRGTIMNSELASRLRELVVVLVEAGRLPPIMVITDTRSSPSTLFPAGLGQHWLAEEVFVSKRGLKCVVWCEEWAKPLFDTSVLPGVVVVHRGTAASTHLVEVLLQDFGQTPAGMPVRGPATVVASLGHDADFAAKVLTLGATFYPLHSSPAGLLPTMSRRVVQALEPPLAWSTAGWSDAEVAELRWPTGL